MVSFKALASTIALSLALPFAEATARGLAWATDNRYAPALGSLPMVSWYHHWQDGPVPEMPSKVEFVPMMWGVSSSAWSNWGQRVAEMKKKQPSHLLSFNEPDISSQANMDPNYAAQVFYEQIMPWKWKGVKVGAPAIAYDLNWLDTFMKALWAKGGNVDFITVHWYGSWKDIAKFKAFVSSAHARFGYKIWVTELGITSASNPSAAQVKNFMMDAYTWMDSTGYVDRASWFGCFIESNPPDNYATGLNGLFKTGFKLEDKAYWYGYTAHADKRSLPSHVARHADIAARLAAREEYDADSDSDCDAICQARDAAVNQWIEEGSVPLARPAGVEVDDLD